ncbi:MAG TPA: 3',5'-cyclic-nucleotide phosphodiesterase [Thermodesulfovibrionales bacterium]|nr:3',5'-cyclic-nucleotide phosphodiesterase [Thermodesulfovibrionales bacterium]
MKLRVLGSSGAEFPGHNPPGFLLSGRILFDAGSLTNVLGEKEQLRIKNIFITHAHLDHIKGIPFLADNIITKNHNRSVNVMSILPVIKTIKRDLFNSSVWPDFTVIPDPCNAIITLVEVKEGSPVLVDDYTVTPYKVNHSVPAVGYLVEDSRKRLFFYTGDTGPTDRTWKKIGNRRINVLIIEVSFPNRMKEMALVARHMTPELLKEELSKLSHMPEMVCVTHPKPQYFETIRKELAALGIGNLRLLKDGEIITI